MRRASVRCGAYGRSSTGTRVAQRARERSCTTDSATGGARRPARRCRARNPPISSSAARKARVHALRAVLAATRCVRALSPRNASVRWSLFGAWAGRRVSRATSRARSAARSRQLRVRPEGEEDAQARAPRHAADYKTNGAALSSAAPRWRQEIRSAVGDRQLRLRLARRTARPRSSPSARWSTTVRPAPSA